MSSVNNNTVDGIVLKMRYLSYLEYEKNKGSIHE